VPDETEKLTLGRACTLLVRIVCRMVVCCWVERLGACTLPVVEVEPLVVPCAVPEVVPC